MAGFMDGFLEAGRAIEGLRSSAQQREMREIEIQNARMAQQDHQVRRTALSEGMAPVAINEAVDGMGPPQVERPLMHVALSNAATKLAERGDLEGAERYVQRAAAQKTLWAEGRISDAWRQGPEALVKVANELSPGANFGITQGQDGSLTITGAGVGGQQLSQTFRNKNELGAWAQQIANPGNLFTAFHEQEKMKLEQMKLQAQANQANASARASDASAQQTGLLTQPKIGLMQAQTGAAQANAVQSYAAANASNASAARSGAEAKKLGIGDVQQRFEGLKAIGFSDDEARGIISGSATKGKAREQAILDVATRLASADASNPAGTPRTQEELLRDASALVDGAASAAGTARVGSGPTQRAPAPTAKTSSATPSGMLPEEQQRAAQIRAAVKSGQMSRADAIRELQALGFQ